MPPPRHACRNTATLAAVCAAACGAALAADPAAPTASTGPRIGLALSGGGARGIAHVGVLKALEEMRIPVHCVTGTSMGAIVGGTFAAGTPPGELEELVLTADWTQIFRDAPPRKEIAIRRKADDYKTLFAPEFGVKDGSLGLPKGVIAGVSIEAFFRQLAEPAIGTSDFGKLPIPFAAMATDIETGESVVLTRGSVAEAMRASMAVPGAIAPVEIDDRLLVDGGIANNLPIDEARKLCGDVVIAVNISTPPLQRKDLTSALTVAAQLINFLGKSTVDRQLRSLGGGDVLIEPDLGDISATSFLRSRDAILAGEVGTRARAGELARYALSPEQYAMHRARQAGTRASLGPVAEIRFEGLKRTNPEVLRGLIAAKPGEPLSEDKIGADLRHIYGRGDFEGVGYQIRSDDGPRTMVITPREKSWGPNYLRFGLGLYTDFRGESSYNLLVQHRRTWLNRLGAEWLTEFQLGQDTHAFGELYQPLDEAGAWFASVQGYVGRVTRGVFLDGDRIADYLVGRARAGLDFGRVFGTTATLRAGASWSRLDARVEVGDPVLPSLREVSAGPRVALTVDQLDHAWYPRSGYAFGVIFYAAEKSFGSESAYQRLEGRALAAKSWGEHTINLQVDYGSDLNSSLPGYDAFTLGGPLRLSGFRPRQFAGREYAFGRLMYYHRAVALPDLLGAGLFVGASAEIARMRQRFDGSVTPGTLYSGSLFLSADTAAGPAYLGVGVGNDRAFGVYLLLGAP